MDTAQGFELGQHVEGGGVAFRVSSSAEDGGGGSSPTTKTKNVRQGLQALGGTFVGLRERQDFRAAGFEHGQLFRSHHSHPKALARKYAANAKPAR